LCPEKDESGEAMKGSTEQSQFEQWHRFWRSEPPESAREAIKLPSLSLLWQRTLEELSLPEEGSVLLELGAGAGSVSRIAAGITSMKAEKQVAFDASTDALALLEHKETAVAGDIRHLPFAANCAKLLTSQFAVEYAGVASMIRALDCVSSGGYFVYVLHFKGSVIDAECGSNRALVQAFTNSDFMGSAKRLLLSVLGHEAGPAQKAHVKAFKKALLDTESTLLKAPECQAKDTVLQVYNAIADMIETPAAFDLNDVLSWFELTSAELAGYVARMSQMQSVALSDDELLDFTDAARSMGFKILREGVVRDTDLSGRSVPIAFHVVGQRDRSDAQ